MILLAVVDSLESTPYRHLRLAETHVPAHQALHRARGLHVGLDLIGGLELMGCLLVGEGRLQLLLPRPVRTKRVPSGHLALRVGMEHLLRRFLQRLSCFLFGSLPHGAAELVQARNHAFLADVLLDQVQLIERHEHGVISQVAEVQAFRLPVIHNDLFQPAEAADTVVDVNHEVTRLQLVVEEPLGPPGPARGHRPWEYPVEYLVIGQHGEARFLPQKAGRQPADRQVNLLFLFFEHVGHALALDRALGVDADVHVLVPERA